MEHCLEDQAKQAMRLLNGTGVSGAETLDQATYNERLQRASIFFNETLITCVKSKFLTVSCWPKKAYALCSSYKDSFNCIHGMAHSPTGGQWRYTLNRPYMFNVYL